MAVKRKPGNLPDMVVFRTAGLTWRGGVPLQTTF